MIRNIFIFVVICIIITLAKSDDSIVTLKTGKIKGVVSEMNRAFYGVPYVEAPVGKLRFKPPASKLAWEGVMDVSESKQVGCPQRCELPPFTCPETQSEDCVRMSIFTPPMSRYNKDKPWPVLLFFPGGHFEQGTADCPLYDAGYLANRANAVVVVVGYRLGALGFVANKDINLPGNMGFLDQQEALRFVRDNIVAFHGDPNLVTISGQSAGAVSVSSHLLSPVSEPLFHRAIVMSNPMTLPLLTYDLASEYGRKFTELLNCDSIECLQEKPVEAVVEAQYQADKILNYSSPLVTFMRLSVTADGENVPMDALTGFVSGKYNTDKPVMVGTVSEEAHIFIYMAIKEKVTDLIYSSIVTYIFLQHAPEIMYHYPPAPFVGDKRDQLGVLGTDYIFMCPSHYAAEGMAQHGKFPTYVYEFNHSFSFDGWGPRYPFCNGHVCHGADLPFFFNSHSKLINITLNQEEINLANTLIDNVANFMRTGNPNKGENQVDTYWAPFSADEKYNMELMTPHSFLTKDLRSSATDMFNRIDYVWGIPRGRTHSKVPPNPVFVERLHKMKKVVQSSSSEEEMLRIIQGMIAEERQQMKQN